MIILMKPQMSLQKILLILNNTAFQDSYQFRHCVSMVLCGQKNLDKAIAASKDHYDFKVCSLSLSLSLCLCVCVCTHVCVPTLIFYQLHL